MNKYRQCPNCGRQNLYYASSCDACGADVRNVPVTESAAYSHAATGHEDFAAFLRVLAWLNLAVGVAGAFYVLFLMGAYGFGRVVLALLILLAALTTFGALAGIAKLLERK